MQQQWLAIMMCTSDNRFYLSDTPDYMDGKGAVFLLFKNWPVSEAVLRMKIPDEFHLP
jgi:hypothetical protein